MFRFPSWTISAAHAVGCASVASGVWLLVTEQASTWWLLGWFVMHLWHALMVSVGLHRYFSHGAFKTTPFWHRVMALYSVPLLYGSPYAWATMHTTHHARSDTDLDPHYTDWTYLFYKGFRDVPMAKVRLRRMVGDPVTDFVHRNGAALWAIFAVAGLLISPAAFLFLYLMPMGSSHIAGAIHQVIGHWGGRPRDLAALEFVLPAAGEWHHGTHHDHPGWADFRTKWWHLDLGAAFIRLIRTN